MALFYAFWATFFATSFVFLAISDAEDRGFTYSILQHLENEDKNHVDMFLNTHCPNATVIPDVYSELECAIACGQQSCVMARYDSGICSVWPAMTYCAALNYQWSKKREFDATGKVVACSMLYRGEFCQYFIGHIGEQLSMDDYKDGNNSLISIWGSEQGGVVHGSVFLTLEAKIDEALHLDGGYVDFGNLDTCLQDWDRDKCHNSFTVSFLMKVKMARITSSVTVFSSGVIADDGYAVRLTLEQIPPPNPAPNSFRPQLEVRHKSKRYSVGSAVLPARPVDIWEHYTLIFDGDKNGLVRLSVLINGTELAWSDAADQEMISDGNLVSSRLVFGSKLGETYSAKVIIDDFFIGKKVDMTMLRNVYKTPNYGLV